MYVSQIKPISFNGYEGKFLQKTSRLIDRSILQKKSDLANLNGYYEKQKAKKWVAAYTAGNSITAAAMAQCPGVDEVALSGVEAAMTMHIMNGIYNFNLSTAMIKSVAIALAGHKAGTTAFKAASKFFTVIPVFGNGLNAIISGTTTAALGVLIISFAEKLDKYRQEGKPINIFLIKDLLKIFNTNGHFNPPNEP